MFPGTASPPAQAPQPARPHASPCVGVTRAEPAMGVEWHWHSVDDGAARLLPDAEA